MQLETVSRIKGGVALVFIGLPILISFWPEGGADFAGLKVPLSAMFWIGIFVGISWAWQRKRMRFIAYQAKLNRKG